MARKQNDVDTVHLHLQSGTGRDVDVQLHFYADPKTNDEQDVAQIFNVLADNLQHRTFTALVEHILEWRRKCGYQIPLSFPSVSRSVSRGRGSDPHQTKLFPTE